MRSGPENRVEPADLGGVALAQLIVENDGAVDLRCDAQPEKGRELILGAGGESRERTDLTCRLKTFGLEVSTELERTVASE